MGVEARTQVCRDGGLEDSPITSRNHPLRSWPYCQLRVDLKNWLLKITENHLRFWKLAGSLLKASARTWMAMEVFSSTRNTHLDVLDLVAVLAWMISYSAKNRRIFNKALVLYSATCGWYLWMIHLWRRMVVCTQHTTSKEFRSDCRTQTCDLSATGTSEGWAVPAQTREVSAFPSSSLKPQYPSSWLKKKTFFSLQKKTHKIVAKVGIWEFGSHT